MIQEQILIQTAKRKIKPTNRLTIGPESIWSSPIFAAIRALISQNYLNKLILIAFTFTLLSSGSIWGAVPDISLSTTSVDIGDVAVGGNGTGTFTITNDGGAALQVTSISIDNAEFSVAPGSATLPGGQNQVVTVTFSPSSTGSQSTTITITSNDPDEGTLTVSASGNGVLLPTPEISLSTDSISISDATMGDSGTGTFDITNVGDAELAVSEVSSDNAEFTVSPTTATIPPGQSQTITVTFSPSSSGYRDATITVVSNDFDEGTLTVRVFGKGVSPPTRDISLSTLSLDIGDVLLGSSGTGTFDITNVGGAALTVSSISSDNIIFSVNPDSVLLSGGQTQTVTVTFDPVSPGNQSSTITITSNDPDEGTLTVSASGNGIIPQEINLSTTSITLGDVTVDSSGTGTFTITNEGDVDLVVSSISSDNAKFSVTPGSATLPGGQNQVVTVTFTPGSPGNQSATITITSNDSDEGTLTVSASGNGIIPQEINLSTTSITLGDVTVGSSGTGTFTITNEGDADLVVSSISSDNAEFSAAPGSATLPGGQNQVVTVTFTPGSPGNQSTTITITSNDPDEGTLTVSASGNGAPPPAPEISLSTTSVSFGKLAVGSSKIRTFTITNDGNADLAVSNISSDNGAFSFSPTSATIPGGQNQVVTVTFSPATTGNQSTTITITSNDSDEGTLTVSASGNVVQLPAPEITLSTTSLFLGNLTLGSSSTLTFTITNEGDADLVVSGINSGNENFSVSPASATIPPAQNQVVTVTFSPSSVGSQSTTITITNNDPDEGTLTVSANGNGSPPPAPEITLSTTSISFGNVAVDTSSTLTFTITNEGDADLVVSSISSDNAEFSVAPSSATIPGGRNQVVTVTFSPSSVGSQSTTITITSNDPDEGTLTVSANGNGSPPPAPEITLSTTSLFLGNLTLGSSSTTTFTITNEGDADLVVSSISSDNAEFSVAPSSATIPGARNQVVTVTFSPSSTGSQSTTITITSNNPDEGTLTVSANGNGSPPPAPEISLSTTSITLGEVTVGSSSSETFTITNEGGVDLVVSSISIENGDFSVSPASATILPGQNQVVTVTFSPSSVGSQSGTITITSNDPDENPLTINIIGICIEPPALEITLSATSIDFGDVTVGTSATGLLYITNKGDADLVIAGISIDNDMFSVSPESAMLIVGTILKVEIRFNPNLVGIQKANLTITSTDSNAATLAVSVSGNGIVQPVPEIKLSTTFVDLGSVMIGSTGSGIFKITNDGNADLVIADISSDNGSFFVSMNSATINPGQTEIVTVTFKPNEPGAQNAAITIVSNDPDNVELVVRVSCSAVVAGHGSFALNQNSPNPFNPSTTISYSVPDGVSKKITIKIFDIRGRLLRVLANRVCEPGTYSVVWDGTDKSGRALPSGIYLYRFEAGDFVQIRKMVMVK